MKSYRPKNSVLSYWTDDCRIKINYRCFNCWRIWDGCWLRCWLDFSRWRFSFRCCFNFLGNFFYFNFLGNFFYFGSFFFNFFYFGSFFFGFFLSFF
ncbi:MAG: hypothetical protein DBX03_01225, partial [Puniceicoccaceae bacterium]